ncbi:hypothetical protein, partial [Bacillus cereus]|uniref:hypothetical protein n=1 Tax=Bacillus cereus TaxID=1396 RepID=UPI0009D30FB1
MKKTILTIGLGSLVALSGCGAKDGNEQGNGILDTTSPTRVNSPAQYYDEDYRGRKNDSEDFGFTRVNNATGGDDNTGDTPTIDREQL